MLRPLTPASERPFVMGFGGTDILADPEPWTARFADDAAILCPVIFDAPLLDRLSRGAAHADFKDETVAALGTRSVETPQRIGKSLSLMLQRPTLLRWLEQVTGRDGLMGADGRLVQTRAGHASDQLDWHNDCDNYRRALGITISFTDAAFAGGQFELRRVRQPASGVTYTLGPVGTACIFAVDDALEHRVLPLLAGGPRRVFTGWILRAPPMPTAIMC